MKKLLLVSILFTQVCLANTVILEKNGIKLTKDEIFASYSLLSDRYKKMIQNNPVALTDMITDLFVNKEIAAESKATLEALPHYNDYKSVNDAKFMMNLAMYNDLDQKLKDIDFNKQAKEYYKVHKDKFKTKPTYDLYQIAFLKENNLSTVDPKKKAEEVLKSIKDKKTTFADDAKKYTISLVGNNENGELKDVDIDKLLPDVKTAVKTLKENEMTGIIETNIAYHIFYLIKKNPAELKPFDAELEKQIAEKTREDFINSFYIEKKDEYTKLKDVKISDQQLKDIIKELVENPPTFIMY